MAGKRSTVSRARGDRRGESGAGLAYVLIVGAVLLILLTTLVDVLVREMKWIVGTGKRNVMIHAADGAIDRAMHALQVGGNWDAMGKGLIEGYRKDVTFTDIPEIAYTIKVQEGNWTPYPGPLVLAETGFTPAGDKRLDRTITIYLSNTRTGEKKKIQTVVMQTTLDSALFSGGVIGVSGSAEVHWGPVVSYSLLSNSMDLGKAVPDYPIYISAGGIVINSLPAGLNSPSLDCDDPIAGKCVSEQAADTLGPMPEMPLDTWRATAQAQAKSDPTHYYAGVCGIQKNPAMPVMDANSVVFFDSMDGKNFKSGTDTLCSGAYSGGNDRGTTVRFTAGTCGQGIFVVMGDLDTAGNGACADIMMKAPSNCVGKLEANAANCADKSSWKLFWDGFIYVGNKLTSIGTKMLYGSMFVYDNTGIGGNFSVYYKSSNSGLGTLGKTITRKVWMERAPLAGEKFP
jgi:hypothetical protein